MAGIGERLKEMMPGSTTTSAREEETGKTATGTETQEKSQTQGQFHDVTQRVEHEEGGVNTLGYNTAAPAAGGQGATCNREFFTKVEDQPRMIARHEFIKEHVPVEREYVVETRFIGEKVLEEGRYEEVVGVEERIVDQALPKSPCE
jgi:hypothetical protein